MEDAKVPSFIPECYRAKQMEECWKTRQGRTITIEKSKNIPDVYISLFRQWNKLVQEVDQISLSKLKDYLACVLTGIEITIANHSFSQAKVSCPSVEFHAHHAVHLFRHVLTKKDIPEDFNLAMCRVLSKAIEFRTRAFYLVRWCDSANFTHYESHPSTVETGCPYDTIWNDFSVCSDCLKGKSKKRNDREWLEAVEKSQVIGQEFEQLWCTFLQQYVFAIYHPIEIKIMSGGNLPRDFPSYPRSPVPWWYALGWKEHVWQKRMDKLEQEAKALNKQRVTTTDTSLEWDNYISSSRRRETQNTDANPEPSETKRAHDSTWKEVCPRAMAHDMVAFVSKHEISPKKEQSSPAPATVSPRVVGPVLYILQRQLAHVLWIKATYVNGLIRLNEPDMDVDIASVTEQECQALGWLLFHEWFGLYSHTEQGECRDWCMEHTPGDYTAAFGVDITERSRQAHIVYQHLDEACKQFYSLNGKPETPADANKDTL